ncbi:MAG: hypothetical protein DSY42_03610 [Aquifex sp.]|nr:MAG: hypothetical protein DSY42_03610 [Aquifex sp.]
MYLMKIIKMLIGTTKHIHKTMPYASANINIGNLDKHMTKSITRDEMNSIIKHMNNNSPGQTNINKTIIKELTDKAITPLYN